MKAKRLERWKKRAEVNRLLAAKGFESKKDWEFYDVKADTIIKTTKQGGISGKEDTVKIGTYGEIRNFLLAHNININVKHKPWSQKYGYSISSKYQNGDGGVLKTESGNFNNYKDALIDGINEAVKFI